MKPIRGGLLSGVGAVVVLLVFFPPISWATFPGDNGRIVFERPKGLHQNVHIYSIRPEGTHLRRITDKGSQYSPSVSPSGRTVAFEDDLPGDIFTIGINGHHLRRIIDTPGFDRDPAFSGPFGKRIAYQHFPPGSHTASDIWVALSDGSARTKLTDTKGVHNSSPAFSPNGRKIAFERWRHPLGSEIYVMRSDGTRVHRLTDSPLGSWDPCFSPSGKRIVFARKLGESESAIFVMRRNGSHVHRLTPGRVFDGSPTFSPNGRRIAFTRTLPNREGQIMVMRRNGTHDHKITHTRVDEEAPEWAVR